MIEKVAFAIDEPIAVKEITTEAPVAHFDFWGERTIYKRYKVNVPDYEQTNINFAHTLSRMIIANAKRLGEIVDMHIDVIKKGTYHLVVRGLMGECEETIDVPKGYGDEY